MSVVITLEDALASGRGEERPFTCPDGEHSHPTASVNVLKMVWHCFSCKAKGAVDSTRVPTDNEIEAMLRPEEAVRVYPSSFLDLFSYGGYWGERFPAWLCWALQMGEDPFSGEGTYPVHTPGGQLAGVCRRALTEGPWPKYKYPRAWSASRALFGSRGAYLHHDVLMLGEGAADAASGWETGMPSFATYGSGLHHPQVELVQRMTPKVVLLGFDNDKAGHRAAEHAALDLEPFAEVARIDWKEYNDPAEAPVEERFELITDVVPGRYVDALLEQMDRTVMSVKGMYEEELQDASTA